MNISPNHSLDTTDFARVISDQALLIAKYDAALNALQRVHQEMLQEFNKLKNNQPVEEE